MLSAAEKSVVLDHLERLVVSAQFARSDRIVAFLRFIVLHTLNAPDELLKERTVGIAVFGRPTDWDPKVDTIVRTEARRLRRKLSNYYASPAARDQAVRLEVPTGSYIPVFRFELPPSYAEPEVSAAPVPEPSVPRLPGLSFGWRVGVMCAIAILITVAWFSFWPNRISAQNEPFETISLTSDEGLQFSPSVSPDGRQVAYVWDQGKGAYRIYIKDVSGGPARAFTHGSLPEFSPAWSRDGKAIAFVRGHGNSGEVTVRTVASGEERIVATIAMQTGNWTDDTSPLLGNLGPSWSSDGASLVVSDGPPHAAAGLYLISLSDGIRRQLTQTQGSVRDFLPSVSPDGDMVAFIRGLSHGVGDIYLLNLQTLQPKQLTFEGHSVNGLSWSSTSGQLIFSSNRGGAFHLWTVDKDDKIIRKLNTDSTTAVAPQAFPHSKTVAYVAVDESWAIHRIQLRNGSDSGEERLLASSGRNHSARYSPDGKQIAFVSDRSGSWQIWLSDVSGTNLRQWTDMQGAWIGGLAWSPDSTQVYFDARPGTKSAIYRISLKGRAPILLEKNDFEERMPFPSADGRFLFFNSDRGGSVEIWKRDLATNTVVQSGDRNAFMVREVDSSGTLVLGDSDGKLWRMEHGQISQVVAGATVSPVLAWTSHNGSLFYFDKQASGTLNLVEYRAGSSRVIRQIRGRPTGSSEVLDVSPDGEYLLMSMIDHSASNVYIRRTSPATHSSR